VRLVGVMPLDGVGDKALLNWQAAARAMPEQKRIRFLWCKIIVIIPAQ
jgi:hypothetical protein